MPDVNGHTPAEATIMCLLQDGHPHRPDEIKAILDDTKMSNNAVRVLLSNLRKKLRQHGQDISVERAPSLDILRIRLVRLTESHARYGDPI